MKIDYEHYVLMNLMDDILERVSYARELGVAAVIKAELLDLYNEVEEEVSKLKDTVISGEFLLAYVNKLGADLNKFVGAFPSSYGNLKRGTVTLQKEEQPSFKNQQEGHEPDIQRALKQFKITASFFTKLNFLNSDLVVVGANGSGKTSLAWHLTTHIKNNGVLIPAERILKLPAFESIRSYATTTENVKAIQLPDEESVDQQVLADEFGILIEHLFGR
jgi:hypothetical protein